MSSMKDFTTVKDVITFTLNEADLTGKKVGQSIDTPKRDIPRLDGVQWWMWYYPAGSRQSNKGCVSIYLHVNKPVTVSFTFAVDGSSFTWNSTYNFYERRIGAGCDQFASHEQLRPLFRDGGLTITCSAEFTIAVPFVPSIPRNFQLFQHVPTDVELVVGSERVMAHKYFLSLISPVFHAMFAKDTAESKLGKVKITDFDFNTVKSAIDNCYGHELKELSPKEVISILRFADKYFITAITHQYEMLPPANLSTDTFCDTVRYAYDCNIDRLLTFCGKFFTEHQGEICDMEQFLDFPEHIVVHLLKSAFDLNNDFDVLRYAHLNDIEFIVEYLEEPLLKQMTIDNFCAAVSYAWHCKREDLKRVCAKFFNDNVEEVIDLNAFHELPDETMGKLMKTSYILKRETKA